MTANPIPPETSQSFHRRLFDWVASEWRNEIASDYSLLALPQSVEAGALLAVLRAMPLSSVVELASGLNRLRPVGPKAVVGDLVGAPSATEVRLVQRFRDEFINKGSNLQLTGQGGSWTVRRLNRSGLRTLLRSSLPDIAGEIEEFGGRYEWRHWKNIGSWRISTHIDLSDPQQQLVYHHGIWLGDVPLADGLSLMSWLGIMGTTRWNTAEAGNEPRTAEAVGALTDHFLQSLPSLLESL